MGVVQAVLVARLEMGRQWPEVVASCSQEGTPALRTMQRWVAAVGARGAAWLAAVGAALAAQDQDSPWLQPRGPTAAGQSVAAALLGASLYLLAWAKTRWPQLAGYGVSDRLAFLGHWGNNRGLRRLV